MDFGLNPDQESLQTYARDFLDKECPPAFVRKVMESDDGFDAGFYKHMADLGWMGIAIPEEHGGQGMSYVDLAVLLEEMGRALVPGPFFASVCLGAVAVQEAGTDAQRKAVLPAIASGERRATVAYTEASGRVDAGGITMQARREGDAWVLDGKKSFVPDAHLADHIVVAARTKTGDGDPTQGVTLFLVDRETSGVSVDQLKTMDTTRRWCEVTFDGVKIGADSVLGEADAGWPVLERALQRSTALLCAESVGGSHKVLDMSVEYAKVRVQFGRPIGSFQAVKHKCAEMLVDVEMARSAMYYAAWAASSSDEELPLAASVAKAYCGDAYTRVASAGIQVHGGIGFTWEHDMHLYFKRAKANEMLLGDPTYHREQVARLVADEAV
ncbi:MAG TPA: acyl-CoA dehydrogenase family protein [Actinomycetota bacterium]|nr:acyl-CoA dehydrogenase family protein [Actinomycetota bacterium]